MTASECSQGGNEPIAIVGSGCRFPGGANSPSKLWELLKEPRDVLTEIPPSRFNVDGFYHADSQYPGHTNVKHSYLIEDDIARFDAQFFNITTAEAVAMDPQQRLLLETVYESLEAAGLTIEGLRGSDTGVYVGVMYVDYENLQFRDLQHVPTYLAIGTARSIVSNRISYFFDWHGPSLTVDTACSSSLVALHQAVQALRSGEVSVAVASGSNLLLGPEPYIHESKLNMLSPDGRSRMWDKGANGYARGDGVASVVLKTLSNAIADGDHIEAIVRETGVNQDGRSRGITMPSAAAQAALIKATYAKAGLPLGTAGGPPCQYFEAHGTGTPAGDPVEAEAVHTAFFGDRSAAEEAAETTLPLFVGSIKTVIGHTESTAGLAGILKVVQAMKHGQIPPNLLLEQLNPAVLPFYRHLHVPRKLAPWPGLPLGQCRRASVNSFGFGGTNAHVILESYEPRDAVVDTREDSKGTVPFAPFVFSAHSKHSLRESLAAHAAYLREHPHTNAADYSWTLRSRRSRLPLRMAFPASTVEELYTQLQDASNNFQLDPRSAAHGGQAAGKSRILGVFTGQGAQWVRMGAALIETSTYAARILADLDEHIGGLPDKYRCSWTLKQQMLADETSSRVNEAVVAQPLCTAVQIILIGLLRAAGIEFAAVVGHSSGEIAAAYAAGHLSACDAIRIAYLRGWHTDRANAKAMMGRMLAVGTSFEDAQELCEDETFVGRVVVAANNSPQSVTLSGDEDAIMEIMEIFQDENKFVRLLRVDKAYHSHHMVPISQEYLESLRDISIQAKAPSLSCSWVSSVYPGDHVSRYEAAGASYWVDNLLSPVLFKQAVELALSTNRFDGAIEVGPHSALKGPVLDTLQSLGVNLPYTGLLNRGTDALRSFSQGLGYLWTHIDRLDIDFDAYERVMGASTNYRFVPGLPVYKWNHDQRYWHESSLSQNLRARNHRVHPLLGNLMPHTSPHQFMWKSILRPRDLPWLHNHRIQGQSVFPAAGFAVAAMEAVPVIAEDRPVQIIEIEDLFVHRAVIFGNDQDSAVEVRCVMNEIRRDDEHQITAHFTFEACEDDQAKFYLAASGELIIRLGQPSEEILPATARDEPYMVNVPADLAYSSLNDVGYGYTGPFRALSGIKRKLGKASGELALPPKDGDANGFIVHPAALDAAFHSIILAFSYPNDRGLWTLHLPARIRRLRVNCSLCGDHWRGADKVPFVATLPVVRGGSTEYGFKGDVEIHHHNSDYCAVQVEGLHVIPFTPATAANDQQTFYVTDWVNSEPNADIPGAYESTEEDRDLAMALERGSFFYLRQLEQQIPKDHQGRLDKHYMAYLNFAAHTTEQVRDGKHRYAKPEWIGDTKEDIMALTRAYSAYPEIMAMHVVGEHMPRTIRGETSSMLEHLAEGDLLGRYYAEAKSVTQGTDILARTVAQITQRYSHARILELGAGTGGATREILKHAGDTFSSYVFTDVSAGFFSDARVEFKPFEDRMAYQVLDLEQEVSAQGFKANSFDVIVASFVLHATKSLEDTLKRVRSLLKPGGYLVIYEVTNVDIIRGTALFGCLPGWWQGIDEGRTLGACVSESSWDAVMRRTGFSGINTMTPSADSLALPNAVLVTQAVDDWMRYIMSPLTTASPFGDRKPIIKHLVVIGGATPAVQGLMGEILDCIRPLCDKIVVAESLESFDCSQTTKDVTVLCLQDLDSPVFKDITDARWNGLVELFAREKSILWVTRNRMIENPFGNMALGFARSAIWEVPEVRYQSVDLEGAHGAHAELLAETLLRFHAAGGLPKSLKGKMTWSTESEIIIDEQGCQRLPRLRPAKAANDRYNSARRPIMKTVSPQSSPVVLSVERGMPVLNELPAQGSTMQGGGAESMISLRLTHSSYRALRTRHGDFFVVMGKCEKQGRQYIGLSNSTASLLHMPESSLVSCSVSPGSEALLIRAMMANYLDMEIRTGLTKGHVIMLHNAPSIPAKLLGQHAAAAGIKIINTTTSKEEAAREGWIHINRNARQSDIISRLPARVSRYVDFTVGRRDQSGISSLLPQATAILGIDALFSDIGSSTSSSLDALSGPFKELEAVVQRSLVHLEALQYQESSSDQISISQIEDAAHAEDATTIINWVSPYAEVAVQTVGVQFKHDRSYWLFGLSSDLGITIADWMVQNGARFLIITSRRPQVNSDWLANHLNKGVVIRIVPCDVTNYDQLQSSYRDICATLPPLAGVYQGSMILGDMALRDMKLEAFTKVLRPKVEGSLNLDRVLADEQLDFLIFFSSTATVAGNPGQAAYTTANLFMSGLALARRRRGLASAVLELGLIMGTGYITREKGDALTRPSFDRGLLTISVSDVHQALGEAINASAPGSGVNWQLSIGLRQLSENAPNRPLWYNYPQFACLTVLDGTSQTQNAEVNGGMSIKDMLSSATTLDEIETIIKESFIAEVRKMLHLSTDYHITSAIRTDELGLDSLIAVRVRSWFLNNFQVNIPALRILKGTPLQDLIMQAVEEIPAELIPGIAVEDQDQDTPLDSTDTSSSETVSSFDTAEGSHTPQLPDTETTSISGKANDQTIIEPSEIVFERIGRLSYTQSVFMFVHQLLDDKTTLNNTVMLQLRGNLSIPDLARAVQRLGERHESQRTCIIEQDGKIVQGVCRESSLSLEHRRVEGKDEVLREYALLRNHEFNLSTGRASRVLLLSLSPVEHYLLMGAHHVFFDRASNDTVLSDLDCIYRGLPLAAPPLQYLDYSEEQYRMHSSGQWSAKTAFWRREYEDPVASLPLHRSRVAERRVLERYASNILDFTLDSDVTVRVRQAAKRLRSTPFHFHLAAVKVLLLRFLGVEDVCIGIADNCRNDDFACTGVGPFLNMLPIRMAARADQTFADAVLESRQKSLSALENSIPLEVILNELYISRQSTHTPLAQVFLNYADSDARAAQSFLGCAMDIQKQDVAELPYDMAFTILNDNASEKTRVFLNVQDYLYSQEDAQIIREGYEDILAEFADATNKKVGAAWRFRQSSLDKALEVGRGVSWENTWPQMTLPHKFESLFPTVANRIAVADENGASMTYQALSQQVDVIASCLLQSRVEPGSVVAVFQESTVQWTASVLAILKIGAVYVPLDPATPLPRLSSMVNDCRPAVILVHGPTLTLVEQLTAQVNDCKIPVLDVSKLTRQSDQAAVPVLARPEAPAIILYTSGSTGTPKGVVLRHDSLVHEFEHCAATYGLGENDIVLQQSVWSFDLSVTQIFLALGVGAKLRLVSHQSRGDSHLITKVIREEGITAAYATPTEYKSWLQHHDLLRASSWRVALVAGEAVTRPLLQLFKRAAPGPLRLFNVYGPTETTCGSTKTEIMYKTPEIYGDIVPVGRASANESFYILDDQLNLLPLGHTGEIAIGGVGVAQGYLHNEERTRRSFLPDPFASKKFRNRGWTTMYRTGDVGYLESDGTLILKGRVGGDTEVKVNGVRVDLRDIEQTVLQAAHGLFADAVASLRSSTDGSTTFLVVYVVPSADGPTDTTDEDDTYQRLCNDLPLPRSILPSAILPIAAIPRTVTGKADRQAVDKMVLPSKLEAKESRNHAAAMLPRNEAVMCDLWETVIPSELLGRHHLDEDSDFFAVGGSSMLLIELQHKIREQLGLSVPLIQLFQASRLGEMARLLHSDSENPRAAEIDWKAETEALPLDNLLNDPPGSSPDFEGPITPPRVIVLTGATGFMGQYLLDGLLRQDHVEKIICIAVRGLDRDGQERRLQLSHRSPHKVEAHQGDLQLPRLGLSPASAARIFGAADAVVHNGADVSHLKTYGSLRAANVASTKELARLCAPRKIPLHYISTTGVTMYTEAGTYGEASVRDAPPPTTGLYGYVASKWASEVYLENAARAYALPVYVHRPSSILRPEEDDDDVLRGQGQGTPAADVLQNMLEYSRRVGAVPELPDGFAGYMDFVEPETVTRGVVDALVGRRDGDGDGVVFVHESGDLELEVSQAGDFLAQSTGKEIATVSLDDWIVAAGRVGLSKAMATVFRATLGGAEPMNLPRLLKERERHQ
ncbi:beta-ketoacyl synthase domain-containing protein [Nemania sp. NC0429]|nr:beta-ketoacyl synthase domain-containing protein [Nemania sp. NC0429]